MSKKAEIQSLIRDYTTYRSLAESPLRNCSYHAFRQDLENVIKMCDEKLVLLYTELKSIEEKEDEQK